MVLIVSFDCDCLRACRKKLAKAGVDIKAWVQKTDADGDGQLTAKEFLGGLQQAGFPCKMSDVQRLFSAFDSNNDDTVETKELLQMLYPPSAPGAKNGPPREAVFFRCVAVRCIVWCGTLWCGAWCVVWNAAVQCIVCGVVPIGHTECGVWC